MIPHNCPTLAKEESEAANRVLTSGWLAQGKEVAAFEDELCEYLDLPAGHAVAVSSGSAALFLALWALEGQNKRVGIPTYSCSALRNAVGLVGANPLYIDCIAGSPNIDPSLSYTKCQIVIVPSMFGIPTYIPPSDSATLVIEDIAQSIGAQFNSRRIGARGSLGICSFYATKLITSGGQGGAIFGTNKALIDKIRDYRSFDCRRDEGLRFNFQLSDLQAAIGRCQLEKLDSFLKARAEIYDIYKSYGLRLIDGNSDSLCPVRQRAILITDRPQKIIAALEAEGIRAIVPVEKWELLGPEKISPNAISLCNSTVSLPIYPTLRHQDAKKIAAIVSSQ